MYRKMNAAPCILLAMLVCSPVAADGDVELVNYMRNLQYFTHKISLSLDANNGALAGFYAHEMEEVIEELEEIEHYDDHPIGKLVESKLEPAFEAFEDSLHDKTPAAASPAFDRLIDACNTCHEATEHGFIVIRRITDNPFMQSFAPLR